MSDRIRRIVASGVGVGATPATAPATTSAMGTGRARFLRIIASVGIFFTVGFVAGTTGFGDRVAVGIVLVVTLRVISGPTSPAPSPAAATAGAAGLFGCDFADIGRHIVEVDIDIGHVSVVGRDRRRVARDLGGGSRLGPAAADRRRDSLARRDENNRRYRPPARLGGFGASRGISGFGRSRWIPPVRRPSPDAWRPSRPCAAARRHRRQPPRPGRRRLARWQPWLLAPYGGRPCAGQPCGAPIYVGPCLPARR